MAQFLFSQITVEDRDWHSLELCTEEEYIVSKHSFYGTLKLFINKYFIFKFISDKII